MCTFNEKASYQIIAVKEFLSNDNNYHLIVVTDTNPMHHDFNLKQIGGQEFDNSRVHFINSFDPLVKGKSKFDRDNTLIWVIVALLGCVTILMVGVMHLKDDIKEKEEIIKKLQK